MRRLRVPIAGATVALLVSVTYFFAFHRPRGDAMAQVRADVEQLRAQQTSLQREIAVLEELADRQDQLEVALERLEGLIPSQLAQPAILAELQQAAGGAGVELTSVAFGTPQPPEGGPTGDAAGTVLVQMPVTVTVEGPYAGVTEMLRRVETDLDRAVLVGTIALTEAEAGYPELTGTWAGQAYALLPADHPLLVGPNAPPADPNVTAGEPESPPEVS